MRLCSMIQVLAVLVGVAAAAQLPRQLRAPITVSLRSETGNLSATISEANDLTVSFQLSEPIICPPEDPHCRVIILLHNSRPDELVLSSCHVIWNHNDNYQTIRNVTVSTVENFVDDGQRNFFVRTEVNSTTELYGGFNLPNITISTEPKNVATCSSTTDPNYRQFDGGNFVVNTAGTFSLWNAPMRDWEVQSRVNRNGFNCGVAVRDGCDRYVIDRCSGTLVMRQYPGSNDNLAPRITRENGDTYVISSQRSGAVVRVRERVRINRSGRSVCGWSGCRIVYHTTRTDWLDITMTAPGRDWGFMDNTNIPRTTGVCGSYNGVAFPNDNGRDCSGSRNCAQFVSNHLVQRHRSLFHATPALCSTAPPPVVHNYDFCDVPPRPIQRPILQSDDIEDITELILGERPEDRVDVRVNFNFDDFEGVPFVNPARPPGFRENATRFCTNALNTESQLLCRLLNVNTSEFTENCVNDMMAQANNSAFVPGAETDTRHRDLALAQLEEMQATCIAVGLRRRENIVLTCDNQGQCETSCLPVNGQAQCVPTCIGDCSISFNNRDLETLVNSSCPNECGANNRINNTVPGRCVQNILGVNVCECNEGFAGNDCSVVVADQPITTGLYPHMCDVSSGACPTAVDIEGEEFYHAREIACTITDGATVHNMNASFVSSTIIRCQMPEIQHSGAIARQVHVRTTVNGRAYSDPLIYSLVDGRCRECSRDGDCSTRRNGTCIINDACHMHQQSNPQNPECQICDSFSHPAGWTYTYEQPRCGPTLRQIGTAIRIPETQVPWQSITHAGVLPFSLRANPYTDGDTSTRTLFRLQGGDADLFSVTSSGQLSLRQVVDYETRSSFSFTLVVERGGLTDSMPVSLEVVNADEVPVWDADDYVVTVAENTLNPSLITVTATDPDGADSEFGQLTYTLTAMNIDSSALQHFSINPSTGVVSITTPLNYEDGARRVFRVVATTGAGSSISAAVEVTVTNVNEAPTAIRLNRVGYNTPAMTLTEDMGPGAIVGQLVVDDPDSADSGSHDIILVDDANGQFAINDQFQIVAVQGGFDYEALSASGNQFFSITVRATDPLQESFDQTLLLTVSDGNDEPTNIQLFGYNPATLSAMPQALTAVPEDEGLGVIGIFTVDDQDSEQSHSFTLVGLPADGTPADGPPFRIYGNELRLVRPLNYELETSYTINVYAIDDGEPDVMQSQTYQFTISVLDRPDLPGYCQFVPANAGGISEATPANTVVGTLSGLDQDPNQNFQLSLASDSPVTVGPSTCSADSNGYTNCSAVVTLRSTIDFESNRVSVSDSVLRVDVSAADFDTAEIGTCTLYVPILNAQDPPSGILVDSLIPGVDRVSSSITQLEVEEAQASLPNLATISALDEDDFCPDDLEGCATFTPGGAYSFRMLSQSSVYALSPECAELRTAASRITSQRLCLLQLQDSDGIVNVGQPTESVQIEVTDGSGLSHIDVFDVVIIPPQVRVSLSFDSVEESVVETSGTSNMVGPVGSVTVSGWTEDVSPTVTLTGEASDLFVISSSRRRDTPRAQAFSVSVKTGAYLDFETQPSVNFSISVAPAGGFTGLNWWSMLTVSDMDEFWRIVVCQESVCRPSSEQAIRVHDDALTDTVVATLDFSDPDSNVDSSLFWRIVRTMPTTSLFGLTSNGELYLTASPSTLGLPNGDLTVEIAVADTSAPANQPVSDRVAIAITIFDDCEGVNCSGHGTCRDQVNTFTCVCDDGWSGDRCSDELIEVEADAATDDSESNTGSIIGIVIGALLVFLLLGAVVLFVRNKRQNDMKALSGLGSRSVNPTMNDLYESVDVDDSSKIIPGVTNPMYDWYKPRESKQSAYQQLSTAQPGSFIIRDGSTSLDNPMYCLHVKTPQALIKDVNINGVPGEVSLVGGGASAPSFEGLPDLVDYYAHPTDQPFVLNKSMLISPMSGLEVYDNALITNKRVQHAGPAVPVKQLN